MKLVLLCLGLVAAAFAENITCTTSSNTTAECAEGVTACHFPKLNVPDNAFTEWACGPCPVNTTDTCDECTGTASTACQAYVAPTMTYKCYKTVNGTQEETTCPAAASISCYMPDATNSNATMDYGCGTCPAANVGCKECTEALCNKNGAASMAFILAPVLAALFALY